jgi:hypothetical protein
MAFHADFWVAAAAASPVITLANTVAITDTLNAWFNAKGQLTRFDTAGFYYTCIVLGVANFVLGAILLSGSLWSLFNEKDELPGRLTIASFYLSMFIVLLLVVFNMILKYWLRQEREIVSEAGKRIFESKPLPSTPIKSGLGWPELPDGQDSPAAIPDQNPAG